MKKHRISIVEKFKWDDNPTCWEQTIEKTYLVKNINNIHSWYDDKYHLGYLWLDGLPDVFFHIQAANYEVTINDNVVTWDKDIDSDPQQFVEIINEFLSEIS